MHAVRFLAAAALAALTASTLALSAVALPGAPAARAAAGEAAAGGTGGCVTTFQPPDSWVVVCGSGSGSGGGPGSGGGGGGGGKYACSLQLLSPANISFLGLGKPPAGQKWAAITCPGNAPFGGVILVSQNGTPAVTPEELLQVAESELRVPTLPAATAPPQGHDGLVGLPEWYWIPAGYRAIHVQVAAGPVWARITATPGSISFDPGGGLSGSSCAGPGVAYSAGGSPGGACTYTYPQSSATQQGGAYAAAVTVNWNVTWNGSDGNGGTLNGDLAVPYQFALRVAEGQALVTQNGNGQ
ncbi:MAG TPA: hypothetical protein VIJ82_30610 [Streptosporangiaceae bacterium]